MAPLVLLAILGVSRKPSRPWVYLFATPLPAKGKTAVPCAVVNEDIVLYARYSIQTKSHFFSRLAL